jgi:hypothetical protein
MCEEVDFTLREGALLTNLFTILDVGKPPGPRSPIVDQLEALVSEAHHQGKLGGAEYPVAFTLLVKLRELAVDTVALLASRKFRLERMAAGKAFRIVAAK